MYTSKYPIVNVTADLILVCERQVLLIQRKTEPFKNDWALIGGFLDEADIDLESTVIRETQEEIGYTLLAPSTFATYSTKGRDPRGRTITEVFIEELTIKPDLKINESEVLEAKWWSLEKLPEMAFDHRIILEDYKNFKKVFDFLENGVNIKIESNMGCNY